MRRASRKQARASLFMSAMDTYGQSLELNSQGMSEIQRKVDSNWLLIAQSLSAPAPKRLFKFPDLNLQNNFLPLHWHYVWASRIAIDFKTSIFCFLHHIHLVILWHSLTNSSKTVWILARVQYMCIKMQMRRACMDKKHRAHTLGATTLALIFWELFLLREVDICLIRWTNLLPPLTCAKLWDISTGLAALDAKKTF